MVFSDEAETRPRWGFSVEFKGSENSQTEICNLSILMGDPLPHKKI
jgi:hypothetical protein